MMFNNVLQSIERRYTELLELSKLRKQKLHDAISLFRLLADADNVEAWIEEKERFLATLDPTQVNDIEELEVIKHRFDGFERDMNSTASKVAIVGHQARTLVQNDHPNSQEILDRINKLNHNWAQLRRLVDKKREDLSSTFGVQTFHIECNETISWIQDKIRIVQSQHLVKIIYLYEYISKYFELYAKLITEYSYSIFSRS